MTRPRYRPITSLLDRGAWLLAVASLALMCVVASTGHAGALWERLCRWLLRVQESPASLAPLILTAALLVSLVAFAIARIPRGGAPSRVKAELSRRGLPAVPLHDGQRYPTVKRGGWTELNRLYGEYEKRHRYAEADAGYWDVIEYAVVSAAGAVLLPPLLLVCTVAVQAAALLVAGPGSLSPPGMIDADGWAWLMGAGAVLGMVLYAARRVWLWQARRGRRASPERAHARAVNPALGVRWGRNGGVTL